MATQDTDNEVIYLRAAGLDLGKRFLVACVRTPSLDQPGRWSMETERFATTPSQIRRLLDWLVERQVEVVVLEATSDYWRYVYYTLQDSARHAHQPPAADANEVPMLPAGATNPNEGDTRESAVADLVTWLVKVSRAYRSPLVLSIPDRAPGAPIPASRSCNEEGTR